MGRDTTGAAIRDAAQRIRVEKSKNAHKKLLIVCGTVIVCVLLVCLTMMACAAVWSQQETIREQQYALNAQYASLMDYVAGAEVVTESADADGGTAIVGDGNTTAGGDIIG